MGNVLPLLVIFGGLAAVLAALVWLACHVRRRGTAGVAVAAALASWEEAYRVTAHESHWEIKAQAERQSPVLSPDGHWPRNGHEASGVRERGRRPSVSRPRRERVRLRRLVRRWRQRG
ncbi:hypothetical protein ACIRQP_36585 [Streptomyces sp. NPDC102274]|uniref:hypothetical protein n=1 Tax=Streptomyces sp. NPDC102274 TaxID=3366151 RepID=UPI003821944F